MQPNEPRGYSDNSRVGIAAVIGGLVLLAAIALGLIANAVNNSGPPTPCSTCTPRPAVTATATKPAPPSEVPTVEGTTVPPIDTEVPPVDTEVPPVSTEPPPVPTDVPTAQPTAPEPVPSAVSTEGP